MPLQVQTANWTAEEWSQNHAQFSLWYAMLAIMVGLPIQYFTTVSDVVVVTIATALYFVFTAHFVYQMDKT